MKQLARRKNMQSPDAIILIASQFDEMDVITCHSVLYERQLSVALVSVMPRLVRSIRGITVYPDGYLSQSRELVSPHKRQMVILAGGEACAAKTLSDPRTHQLVQHVLQQNGYVAAMANTERLIVETGLLSPEWASCTIRQGERETAVFVEQLIQQFICV